MTTREEDAPASVRRAGHPGRAGSLGRDAVLALGLLGTGIGGVAAFLKAAAGAGGGGLPPALVAALALLLLGVLLAKWGFSPVRRPVRTPGPAAHPEPPVDLPDVGGDALDHTAVDADGFEHTVAALCARDGCVTVEVVGGAGDLGADVLATTADGRRVVLQCKHYAEGNRVGSQDLQRFGGTCFAVHEADVAVIVTTSSFTAPAVEYADVCRIVRVDGEGLAAWTEGRAPAPWESGPGEPAPAAAHAPARGTAP
ncbi:MULTISPECIES: restriction endonuclease [unclassified Streptomyces]|uniref:restriction endonuclease n=1 Tax=unclassified Streptomyces TaxID=2593676 RepID=UPI00044FA172|nr:restriction endonuclease [Streptomyces sp. PCS3-D2]WKV75946.1 restriction endonuclease [Streptomyces sp. PCS3-D2]